MHISCLHGLKGNAYEQSVQSKLHVDNVYQVGDLCCTVVTVASLHRQRLRLATGAAIARTRLARLNCRTFKMLVSVSSNKRIDTQPYKLCMLLLCAHSQLEENERGDESSPALWDEEWRPESGSKRRRAPSERRKKAAGKGSTRTKVRKQSIFGCAPDYSASV